MSKYKITGIIYIQREEEEEEEEENCRKCKVLLTGAFHFYVHGTFGTI